MDAAHSSEKKATFTCNFYANLFSGTNHSKEATRKLLKNMKTKISPSNKKECNKPILRENVINAIKSLKNNSSLGLDGIFAEFYKVFADDLATFLTNLYTHSIFIGALPECVNVGSITLLPKKEVGLDSIKLDSMHT